MVFHAFMLAILGEALCVDYSNHGVTCAYSLSVHSVHSMNMVESTFWNNEDWKGKPVGVVPRIHRQHQVGWSSLHIRSMHFTTWYAHGVYATD